MKLQTIIENHWYRSINLGLSIVLLPLSLIFFIISKTRYFLYKSGILKSYKLPVPVVIVGNITVGGAGKTPLTKYLAKELQQSGFQIGVILRGYKAENSRARIVKATDDNRQVGDEALIYAKNEIPVAIGSNRYHAGLELLKAFPDLQLILTDDGMQHYKLQRDYEIAVIDGTRMFGNQFVLPMGPLREPTHRLKKVNSIVINGKTDSITMLPTNIPIIQQTLVLDKIYNPVTGKTLSPSQFKHMDITAIAGIGNPERFFDFVINLGINIKQKIAFPDHHQYQEADLPPDSEIILVTEKDYAKLDWLNNDKIWVILVKTTLDNNQLINNIKQLLSRTDKSASLRKYHA